MEKHKRSLENILPLFQKFERGSIIWLPDGDPVAGRSEEWVREEFSGGGLLIIESFMDSMSCSSLCTRGEVYLIWKSEGGLPLSVNKQ